MRQVRLADDRGRRVRLCGLADLPAAMPVRLQLAIRRAHARPFGLAASILVGFCLVLAALLAMFSWVAGQRFRYDLVALGGCAVVANVLFGLLAKHPLISLRARTAAADCLAARYCPSCAYELSDLAAANDGCTTCPECGAAWRVPGAVLGNNAP